MDGSDDAWQAFIEFSKRGFVPGDDRERWDMETFPPKKKRMRKPRMTLARAMQQASDAGVAVNGATVNADGSVTLLFGEAAPQRNGATGSEWDEVLQ
ncbi:hypothetical protein IVA96_30410 [Bradyrhizobium sp. 159]|uniref:hypothetical protein n=1 Tax=Bradyrhizobium sp. 159 TaxID=2782632 RepID=UPI001FFB4C1F|nr:hypothetical protein [Bradyrhizobium sp. 159]MCK1620809.1 hypothetical protein [Bradyrhizobium sp. 159]